MPRPGPWIPAPRFHEGRLCGNDGECEGTFVLLFRIRGVRTVVKGICPRRAQKGKYCVWYWWE